MKHSMKSGRDLMSKMLNDPVWLVDQLVPAAGTAMVASKPKIGKSWFALDLAIAVAAGSKDFLGHEVVAQGDVLYLALEDNERRLQNRLKTLAGGGVPKGFNYIVNNSRWSPKESVEDIRKLIGDNPSIRMVVVDTMGRILPPKRRGGYTEDYDLGSKIHDLAVENDVAIVLVHHTTRAQKEDVLDELQGTSGVAAAHDSYMVLHRPRGSSEGTLDVIARDTEEDKRYRMEFDGGSWNVAEQLNVSTLHINHRSERREEIVVALTDAGGPMSPVEVAAATGIDASAVRVNLARMVHDYGEVIHVGRGQYTVPGHETAPATSDGNQAGNDNSPRQEPGAVSSSSTTRDPEDRSEDDRNTPDDQAATLPDCQTFSASKVRQARKSAGHGNAPGTTTRGTTPSTALMRNQGARPTKGTTKDDTTGTSNGASDTGQEEVLPVKTPVATSVGRMTKPKPTGRRVKRRPAPSTSVCDVPFSDGDDVPEVSATLSTATPAAKKKPIRRMHRKPITKQQSPRPKTTPVAADAQQLDVFRGVLRKKAAEWEQFRDTMRSVGISTSLADHLAGKMNLWRSNRFSCIDESVMEYEIAQVVKHSKKRVA